MYKRREKSTFLTHVLWRRLGECVEALSHATRMAFSKQKPQQDAELANLHNAQIQSRCLSDEIFYGSPPPRGWSWGPGTLQHGTQDPFWSGLHIPFQMYLLSTNSHTLTHMHARTHTCTQTHLLHSRLLKCNFSTDCLDDICYFTLPR